MVFSYTVTDADAPGIGVVTVTFPDGSWVIRDLAAVSDDDVKLLAATRDDVGEPKILVGVVVIPCGVMIDSVTTEELLNYNLWEFGVLNYLDSPVTLEVPAGDGTIFISRSAVYPDYNGMLHEVIVTGQIPSDDKTSETVLCQLLSAVKWVSPYRVMR